jgi:hypothetical protein
MPAEAQNEKKELEGNLSNFDRLFKDKKLLKHKKYINKVCIEFNCASNSESIIFYFRKFTEYYLIKGRIFDF